jgi:hypothetical protein
MLARPYNAPSANASHAGEGCIPVSYCQSVATSMPRSAANCMREGPSALLHSAGVLSGTPQTSRT